MKPLTLEETALKEEMKERCLAKGQYVDENAKKKFDMLCHLEDFEVQYWELQQENKKYKEVIDKLIEYLQKKYDSSGLCGIVLNFTEFEDIKDLLKEVSE